MVSQPHTPHQLPIPGTAVEIRAIKQLLKNRNIPSTLMEGSQATIDQTIKNMETHSFVHFACHASQNTIEPLKSGFELYNGRLELSAILQKKLVGAEVAFLSACQTSTGEETLSEEALHLAAGMLAAGYRGVVATMWPISDRYAPQVAETFYTELMEGQDGLNGDHAARALHCATQKLREVIGDSESGLLVWVPYVHFGL
jgi:CHAT domain-containing protein